MHVHVLQTCYGMHVLLFHPLLLPRGNTAKAKELYDKAVQYSRNQVEMTQAYVAQKVFTAQDRVCKEYGVTINELTARSVSRATGSPAT